MQSVERNSLYVGEGLSTLQSGFREPGGTGSRLRLARGLLYAITQVLPGLKSQMYLVSQK